MAKQCGDQDGWSGLPIKEEKEFFVSTDTESIMNASTPDEIVKANPFCLSLLVKGEIDNSSDQPYLKSEFKSSDPLSVKSEFESNDESDGKFDYENINQFCVKSEFDMHHAQELSGANSNEAMQQSQLHYVTPMMEAVTVKTETDAILDTVYSSVSNELSIKTQSENEATTDNEQSEAVPVIIAPISSDIDEKHFACHLCDKRFVKSRFLAHHLGTHGKKHVSCDQCDKIFNDPSYLKRHMQIHKGEKPFGCNHCHKRFCFASYLKKHMRLHEGERTFNCDQCDKKFHTSSDLKAHQKIHTGEKPFKCDYCDKTFFRINDMNKHRRIHTGEKPYSCDQCDKKFSQSSILNTHKKVHTGPKREVIKSNVKATRSKEGKKRVKRHTREKIFSCEYCNKSFCCSNDLKIHERIHTGEMPYSCDQCDQRFIRSGQLIIHKRIHTRSWTEPI